MYSIIYTFDQIYYFRVLVLVSAELEEVVEKIPRIGAIHTSKPLEKEDLVLSQVPKALEVSKYQKDCINRFYSQLCVLSILRVFVSG